MFNEGSNGVHSIKDNTSFSSVMSGVPLTEPSPSPFWEYRAFYEQNDLKEQSLLEELKPILTLPENCGKDYLERSIYETIAERLWKEKDLIYEMEVSPQAVLHGDYSIEEGQRPLLAAPSKDIKPEQWQRKNLETAVNPSKNKLKNVYLHLRKDGMDMFYPIPLQDKRWQAFLALYRSSDTCQRGHMIERRNRIIAEQNVYSSLNNTKRLGIFKAAVKPLDLTDLDREKAIKAANLTIEEKRELSAAQTNGKKAELQTAKDIVAKINKLRCSKAQTSNIQTTGIPRTLSKEILQHSSQSKKLYS